MTYKFKILCVGMEGVDIEGLTEPLIGPHYRKQFIKSLGVSFGTTKIIPMDEGTESDAMSLTMWRMNYEPAFFKLVFPMYVKGTHSLLLFFRDSERETRIQLGELIRVTREDWEDIPIFLIGVPDESQSTSISKKIMIGFSESHRCADLYFLRNREMVETLTVLTEIADICRALSSTLYSKFFKM